MDIRLVDKKETKVAKRVVKFDESTTTLNEMLRCILPQVANKMESQRLGEISDFAFAYKLQAAQWHVLFIWREVC